jgi:carnitine 3-dehydrogenase
MGDRVPDRAAAVGGGVIGAGWVARLRLNGVDVRAFDPSPDARRTLDEVHANAIESWHRLGIAPEPDEVGALDVVGSIADAVVDADLVIESVP